RALLKGERRNIEWEMNSFGRWLGSFDKVIRGGDDYSGERDCVGLSVFSKIGGEDLARRAFQDNN
ncbi:hypothetical protein K0M31_014183, partial [Melipona bicolor]